MDRAATVSEFIQHLCAPVDTADVKKLRRLAQKLRPTGNRVEFVLVLNTVAQHGFCIDGYPETFIGKIHTRISAINMHSMPADTFVGTIADYLDNMRHDALTAIASVLVCLCNNQATPTDIYAGWVIATYCLSKIHPSSEYNSHIHDAHISYNHLPVSQHIEDEVQLAVIMPMCDPPYPWFRWVVFSTWTATVSAALFVLMDLIHS